MPACALGADACIIHPGSRSRFLCLGPTSNARLQPRRLMMARGPTAHNRVGILQLYASGTTIPPASARM